MSRTQSVAGSLLLLSLTTLTMTACDSAGSAPASNQTDNRVSANGASTGNGGSSSQTIGPNCVSSDPHHICIGVKVVSYTAGGAPALSQDQAITEIQGINDIWKTCDVSFQIEEYGQIDPTTVGLSYGANSENQLTSIRRKFSDDKTFLVAVTGSWTTATIAWTEMPGGAPYGCVVDADYANDPVTVGHELGHYQGLDHVQTSGNLMYPIVYKNDTNISPDQCASARAMDTSFWPNMMRH